MTQPNSIQNGKLDDWNANDKAIKEMEQYIKQNHRHLILRQDRFDVNKVANWLAKKDVKLKKIFEQYINKNELNVADDLKNLSKSKIIKHLIKKSNYKRIDIENIFKILSNAFIKILVLSKQKNLPLLTFIIDNFCRYCVSNNDTTGKDLVTKFLNEFIKTFKWNNTEKEFHVKALLHAVIKDFFYRIGKHLDRETASKQLIDDDINEYIEFTLSFHQYLMRNDEDFWLNKTYPIQIDLWIIPKKTIPDPDAASNDDQNTNEGWINGGNADDSDDDDDDDDFKYPVSEDTKNVNVDDRIKDIADKLKSYKIEYYAAKMDKQFSAKRIGQHFSNFLKGKNVNTRKPQKLVRNHRYIVIYDRRAKKNTIYIFKAMKGYDTFSSDKFIYQYESFFLSSKCVLPKKEGQKADGNKGKNGNIGLFDPLSGYMFGFSYHLISCDIMRVYWCSQGIPLRFFNNDMTKIWPMFFEKSKRNIETRLKNQIEELRSFPDKELNIDDGKKSNDAKARSENETMQMFSKKNDRDIQRKMKKKVGPFSDKELNINDGNRSIDVKPNTKEYRKLGNKQQTQLDNDLKEMKLSKELNHIVRKLHGYYNIDIVKIFAVFCQENEYEEKSTILDDIEEDDDSFIIEHMEQKCNWEEDQCKSFKTHLREIIKKMDDQ